MRSTPLVLLVDDDEDIRDVVRDVLESAGYAVELASDGAMALARLERPPFPSLIVLDLMMPVVDGVTFVRELESRASPCGIPILFSTALPRTVVSTLDLPAYCALVRKPFDLDDFLDKVATHAAPAVAQP